MGASLGAPCCVERGNHDPSNLENSLPRPKLYQVVEILVPRSEGKVWCPGWVAKVAEQELVVQFRA